VQIEMTLLVGDVARREVEIESESGVVDQDADRPLAVGDAGDDRARPSSATIRGQHLDLNTVVAHAGARRCPECGAVTGDQDEVGSAAAS
jgi:hypothetical protein